MDTHPLIGPVLFQPAASDWMFSRWMYQNSEVNTELLVVNVLTVGRDKKKIGG